MRVLTAADVRELVPMADAIELMKQAFAAHSRGETISPLRTPVDMPDGSGVVLFMPAFVPNTSTAPAAAGAKVVSVFGGNAQRGLPTINALVVVVDPSTGVPLGILDGGIVTALRTGAVSGAATDLLARQDSKVLAVIGAGAQGVTQAAAVCEVRDITEIRVSDLNQDSVNSFAERLAAWNSNAGKIVKAAGSAQEAVAGADVICTATTARRAVFEDAWLKPGVHINGIGAYTPEMQEVPFETIARARIIVDEVEACMHEAGDIIQAVNAGVVDASTINIEFGAIADGKATGRENDEQVTFFKSVGNAIQDMIVSGFALHAAETAGRGTQIELT